MKQSEKLSDGSKSLQADGLKGSGNNPNPNGKNGNPIILPPITFEDAVKKALATPAPKEDKPAKKTTKKKR